MFEPAPNCNIDKEIRTRKIIRFISEIKYFAKKYGVYNENRIGLIDNCCDFLTQLQNEKRKEIWPHAQREPIKAFQDVFQILIYAVADRGLIFDKDGYFQEIPRLSKHKKMIVSFDWKISVIQYHNFAFAMRRRNYAYLELINLRKHLDEHYKQEQNGYVKKQINERDCSLSERLTAVDMVRQCTLNTGFPSFCWRFDSDEIEKIIVLQKKIRQDRLTKTIEPFIMFMILSGKVRCCDIHNAANLKSILKPNKSIFPRKSSVKDCKLFSKIMKWYAKQDDVVFQNEHWLFDPYTLLNEFRCKDGLKITDEEFVAIAHLCEDCFKRPQDKKKLESYNIQVRGVEIGQIIKSIFVISNAQNYSKKDNIQPRGWKQSIEILKKTKILPEDLPSDVDASELLDRIGQEYFIEQYSFVWEVFWMITQYVPPPLFDWEQNYIKIPWDVNSQPTELSQLETIELIQYICMKKGHYKGEPYELYAVCDNFLTTVVAAIHAEFVNYTEHVSLPPELRFDIAKARRIFADSKRTTDFREQLLRDMQPWKILYFSEGLPGELANYCMNKYNQLAANSKDANLKSLQQYPEIMKYAMADEVMRQLCAETYAKVFHLLASMNQYLWPIT